MDIWTREITSKIVCGNNVDFLTSEITPIKVRETTCIFWSSKYHRKKKWKERGFSDHRNYIEKNKWEQRGFFDQRNYVKKNTWK